MFGLAGNCPSNNSSYTAAQWAVLLLWLDARCDVTTLPLLSSEPPVKGRSKENVARARGAVLLTESELHISKSKPNITKSE